MEIRVTPGRVISALGVLGVLGVVAAGQPTSNYRWQTAQARRPAKSSYEIIPSNSRRDSELALRQTGDAADYRTGAVRTGDYRATAGRRYDNIQRTDALLLPEDGSGPVIAAVDADAMPESAERSPRVRSAITAVEPAPARRSAVSPTWRDGGAGPADRGGEAHPADGPYESDHLPPVEVLDGDGGAPGCQRCGIGSDGSLCDPVYRSRGCDRERCPCPLDEVLSYYRCGFYGHYPTFWRPWPTGWLKYRPFVVTTPYDRFRKAPAGGPESGEQGGDPEADLQNRMRDTMNEGGTTPAPTRRQPPELLPEEDRPNTGRRAPETLPEDRRPAPEAKPGSSKTRKEPPLLPMNYRQTETNDYRSSGRAPAGRSPSSDMSKLPKGAKIVPWNEFRTK